VAPAALVVEIVGAVRRADTVIVGVTFTCVAVYLIGVAWTQGKTAPAITITLVATLVLLVLAVRPQGNY
jgi:hypothetical protein